MSPKSKKAKVVGVVDCRSCGEPIEAGDYAIDLSKIWNLSSEDAFIHDEGNCAVTALQEECPTDEIVDLIKSEDHADYIEGFNEKYGDEE